MTRGYRFADALATKIAGRFSASRLRTKSDRLLGATFLAYSRPFEGFVSVLIPAVLLLVKIVTNPAFRSSFMVRAFPPLLLMAAAGLGFLAIYNFKTTGSGLASISHFAI